MVPLAALPLYGEAIVTVGSRTTTELDEPDVVVLCVIAGGSACEGLPESGRGVATVGVVGISDAVWA